MSNFQVPQFIDRKPKIVGFLTLPQFLYVAGAALVGYISFYIFNFFIAVIITTVFGLIGVAFAFVKINGQEFPQVVTSVFGYFWQPRLYTWQRQIRTESINLDKVEEIENLRSRMSLQEKLKSAALSVATGKFFKPKENQKKEGEFETVVFLTGERREAKKVDY
ncbi:MAG: PrgI family protein [Minisyncoccia bacterium]